MKACRWGKQFYSDEVKAELRERHAAGETLPALSREMGIPFGTVKALVGYTNEKRRARREARVQEENGRLF
jgi:hypothetical protein